MPLANFTYFKKGACGGASLLPALVFIMLLLALFTLKHYWATFWTNNEASPPYPLDEEEWKTAQNNMAQWEAEGKIIREAKRLINPK